LESLPNNGKEWIKERHELKKITMKERFVNNRLLVEGLKHLASILDPEDNEILTHAQ